MDDKLYVKNPVRFKIFFGNQSEQIKIPDILKTYPDFQQRIDFPVISFLVNSKLTTYNPILQKVESTDPNIKSFQQNFILANQNLKFEKLQHELYYEGKLEYGKDYTAYYYIAAAIAVLFLVTKK